MTTYKLSPSDFAYLYEECKRCFYFKMKGDIARPWSPFPGVFTAINGLLQGGLVGNDLRDLNKELPEGKVINQEGFVDSAIVPGTSVFIKGKYDLLVKNPDGTYTVVDLKITNPAEEKIDKYKSQLWAYKYAMENPKDGEGLKVTKLGLLIFYPEDVEYDDDSVEIDFSPKWFEVPIDDEAFLKFMKEIDDLLKGPLPEEGEECGWCEYRRTAVALEKAE